MIGSNLPLQITTLLWKPADQELFNGPIISSFGEKFCALLISPRVIDDKATLVLAEVNVRIIDILGLGDVLTLLCSKPGLAITLSSGEALNTGFSGPESQWAGSFDRIIHVS